MKLLSSVDNRVGLSPFLGSEEDIATLSPRIVWIPVHADRPKLVQFLLQQEAKQGKECFLVVHIV